MAPKRTTPIPSISVSITAADLKKLQEESFRKEQAVKAAQEIADQAKAKLVAEKIAAEKDTAPAETVIQPQLGQRRPRFSEMNLAPQVYSQLYYPDGACFPFWFQVKVKQMISQAGAIISSFPGSVLEFSKGQASFNPEVCSNKQRAILLVNEGDAMPDQQVLYLSPLQLFQTPNTQFTFWHQGYLNMQRRKKDTLKHCDYLFALFSRDINAGESSFTAGMGCPPIKGLNSSSQQQYMFVGSAGKDTCFDTLLTRSLCDTTKLFGSSKMAPDILPYGIYASCCKEISGFEALYRDPAHKYFKNDPLTHSFALKTLFTAVYSAKQKLYVAFKREYTFKSVPTPEWVENLFKQENDFPVRFVRLVFQRSFISVAAPTYLFAAESIAPADYRGELFRQPEDGNNTLRDHCAGYNGFMTLYLQQGSDVVCFDQVNNKPKIAALEDSSKVTEAWKMGQKLRAMDRPQLSPQPDWMLPSQVPAAVEDPVLLQMKAQLCSGKYQGYQHPYKVMFEQRPFTSRDIFEKDAPSELSSVQEFMNIPQSGGQKSSFAFSLHGVSGESLLQLAQEKCRQYALHYPAPDDDSVEKPMDKIPSLLQKAAWLQAFRFVELTSQKNNTYGGACTTCPEMLEFKPQSGQLEENQFEDYSYDKETAKKAVAELVNEMYTAAEEELEEADLAQQSD